MNYTIGQILTGRVIAVNANEQGETIGLTVSLGSQNCFIPIEEVLMLSPQDSLDSRKLGRKFIGRNMMIKVINSNPLIVSNKQALEEKREKIKLDVGQEIEGVVISVNSKEAKIEYQNCLIVTLPSDEYNYLKTTNLKYVLEVGTTIKVQVLSINGDEIIVTHKPYVKDNWTELSKKYQLKNQYLGRVVNLIQAGVFVNLEPSIDILCSPYPFFEVKRGDEVIVEITDINPSAGKIRGIITGKAIVG